MAGVQLGPFLDIIEVHFEDDEGGEVTHLAADLYCSPKVFVNTNTLEGPFSLTNSAFRATYINQFATAPAPEGESPDSPYQSYGEPYYYWKTLSWSTPIIASFSAYKPGLLWAGVNDANITVEGAATPPADQTPTRATYFDFLGAFDPDDPIATAPSPGGALQDPTVSPGYGIAKARWVLSGSTSVIPVPNPFPGTEHNYVLGTEVTQQVRSGDAPPHSDIITVGGPPTLVPPSPPATPEDPDAITTFSKYADGVATNEYTASGPVFALSGLLGLSGLSLKYTTTVNGVPNVEATFVPIGFSTADGSPFTMPLTVLFKRSDL